MLKTVKTSANKKTGPIAVTYRAGSHNVYGTCPSSCALNPQGQHAAALVDNNYVQALRFAVPKHGQAWTYSHFPAELLPLPAANETVFNISCDTIPQALAAHATGRPAVVAAPAGTVWPHVAAGVKFIQCPAELSDDFNCGQCGGGRPLCARGERDYVIVFVAHGSGARMVGTEERGGCYGNTGPVRLAWENTKNKGVENDAVALASFVKTLPYGSFLRHHVVGDVGVSK